jgi:hypothetical protein
MGERLVELRSLLCYVTGSLLQTEVLYFFTIAVLLLALRTAFPLRLRDDDGPPEFLFFRKKSLAL